MKIVVKETQKVIGEIITNHRMTIWEAMALTGWEWNDDWGVWETDEGDYGWEDLEMI